MTKLQEFIGNLPGIPTEGKQEVRLSIEDVLRAFVKLLRQRTKEVKQRYPHPQKEEEFWLGWALNEITKEFGLEDVAEPSSQ